MPLSAIDSIPLAFQHTRRQLFGSFRFWQWTKLALVGFLAGELGGGFSFPTSFPQSPATTGGHPNFPHGNVPAIVAAFVGLIAVLVIAAFVVGILFLYISSVMRFILFDSVLTKECRIREGWRRNVGSGWRYFLFHILYSLSTFFVLIVVAGLAAGLAFAMGWLKNPGDHILPLVLGGIFVFLLLFVFFLAAFAVLVLTKDFVVPQMALENIGVMEGWRRLWAMMMADKRAYAGYLGMKILLAIGASFVVGIASFILIMLIIVPSVLVGVVAVITGKSAGLTWDAYTITLAVVLGCILLAVLMYLTALISVPVIVFFPAYAMYFFAPRYRPLSLALYPAPPAVAIPAPAPPQEPPPLIGGPMPEPIG